MWKGTKDLLAPNRGFLLNVIRQMGGARFGTVEWHAHVPPDYALEPTPYFGEADLARGSQSLSHGACVCMCSVAQSCLTL